MTKKEKAATRQHKLKKCPFCDSEVVMILQEGFPAVYCPDCDKLAPNQLTAENAAKAWNGK